MFCINSVEHFIKVRSKQSSNSAELHFAKYCIVGVRYTCGKTWVFRGNSYCCATYLGQQNLVEYCVLSEANSSISVKLLTVFKWRANEQDRRALLCVVKVNRKRPS